MTSKVRLGHALTIQEGYKIKWEAVFSTSDSVPSFEIDLWSLSHCVLIKTSPDSLLVRAQDS